MVAALGNLRILGCVFSLMVSLKQQQCEIKDTLWQLRQVACLVIIRHVIFTSSPPVVESCAWLIRAIHTQLDVLWCSSQPCAALHCVSASSQSTDCVCLLMSTHLSFSCLHFISFFLMRVYAWVYMPVCILTYLWVCLCTSAVQYVWLRCV